MNEETTDPAPIEEVPETAPETPEIDPEILELVKSLDPETIKNAKNLDEFYKRVNAKSMEVAEERRKLEAERAAKPTPAPTKEGPSADDLDPHAQEVLRAFLARELGPVFSTFAEDRKDTEKQVWTDFTSVHSDVPPDLIAEKFYELGYDKTANTPVKYKAALEKCYKIAKADTVDVDALVEQKLAARLAELKAEGGEIVNVRAKRSEIEPKTRSEIDIVNDTSLTWDQKQALLNR